MAITITSDTVVKIIVRSGTNLARTSTLLSQGELAYTIDTKRLFVGDGITIGGLPAGTKNFGIVPPNTRNSITGPQVGDLVYDTGVLYTYASGVSSWEPISPVFDNQTIIQGSNGIWSVNSIYLSGSQGTALSSYGGLSANWNQAFNTVSTVAANGVLINASNNTGNVYQNPSDQTYGVTLGPSQILANPDGNGIGATTLAVSGGLTLVTAPVGTNHKSGSLIVDASGIQNQVNILTNAVNQNTQDITDIGTTFYNETSFVYGVDTYNGTAGLSNMWQNVFLNQSCQPLRIPVTTGSRSRVVLVEGCLTVYSYGVDWTNWARLATFANTTETTTDMLTWNNVTGSFPLLSPPYTANTPSTVPLDVLDVANWTSPYGAINGTRVHLRSIYTIPANSVINFGLQTFFYCFPKATGTGIQVNGWGTGSSSSDNYYQYGFGNNQQTRNVQGFASATTGRYPSSLPSYKGIYAWGHEPQTSNNVFFYNQAPGSDFDNPQNQPGFEATGFRPNNPLLSFNDTSDVVSNGILTNSVLWGTKNISYVRATYLN
jgi:hypothetical protein